MARFKCPDCKKRISTQAKTCPKCGRTITAEDSERFFRKQKKKIKIAFGILVVFAILVTATSFFTEKPEEVTPAEMKGLPIHAEEFLDNIVENANAKGYSVKFGDVKQQNGYDSVKVEFTNATSFYLSNAENTPKICIIKMFGRHSKAFDTEIPELAHIIVRSVDPSLSNFDATALVAELMTANFKNGELTDEPIIKVKNGIHYSGKNIPKDDYFALDITNPDDDIK